MKKWVMFVVFILLVNGVHAITLSSQSCEVNGEFSIKVEAQVKDPIYTNEMEVLVDGKVINGEWDINFIKRDPPDRRRQFGVFDSDEGQVLGGGNKILKVNYPLGTDGILEEKTLQEILECPAFHFSCSLLGIRIDECYTEENTFYGYFYAEGFEQSDVGKLSLDDNLDFGLFTEEVYEDINDFVTISGAKPKTASVEKVEGSKYVMIMEFPNENFVNRFRINAANLDKCLDDKYDKYNLKLNDVANCVGPPVVEEIEEIEENVIEEEIIEVEEPEIEEVVLEDVEFTEIEDDSEGILAVVAVIILAIGFGVLFKFRDKLSGKF